MATLYKNGKIINVRGRIRGDDLAYLIPDKLFSDDLPVIKGGKFIKWQRPLKILKKEKLVEIQKKFKDEFRAGTFISSLGIEVDNRRWEEKNDLEDVQNLIKDYSEPVLFKGKSEKKVLSLEELKVLELELIKHRRSMRTRKIAADEAVKEAVSAEKLDEIKIDLLFYQFC